MHNVFVRYSAENAAETDRLCAHLGQVGADCYRVSGRTTPASPAAARHNEAIGSMRVYIVVCGGSVPSEASAELYLAKQRTDVRVIAYLTADTPTPEGAERVEAFADEEQALARTAQLVREQLARFPQENNFTHDSRSPQGNISVQENSLTAEEKPSKPKKSLAVGAVLGTVAAIAVLCVGGMAFLTNTKTGHRILDMLDGVSYEQTPSKPGRNEIKFYGHRYSGEYSGETDKDGTADGTGHFSGSDGSRTLEIDGTFAEGIPVGECRSILIFNNGDREEYTGGFEDGEYKGVGTSTYFFIAENDKNMEKKVLQGEWLDGENLSEGGTDTTYYHDGRVRVYKGSWAKGTWGGSGVLTMNFPDDNPRSKSVTEGEWVNGSLSGNTRTVDEYRDGDTRVYEGEYSDGNWNGNGVLTISHTDGSKSVLEGTWKDGELVKGTDTDYKKDGSVKKTEEVDLTSESE